MNENQPQHAFSTFRKWLLKDPKWCPSQSPSGKSLRLFQQLPPKRTNEERFSRGFKVFFLILCGFAILLGVGVASSLFARMDTQPDNGQDAKMMTEDADQGQDSWRNDGRVFIADLCKMQHLIDTAKAAYVDPNSPSYIRKAYEESYLVTLELEMVIPAFKEAIQRLIDGETSQEAKAEFYSLGAQYTELSKKLVERNREAFAKVEPFEKVAAAVKSQAAARARAAERKTRSWTDEYGNTMTESQEQDAFDKLRRRIESESNPYMKAYWEGVEKALLKERVKIQAKRGW